MRSAHHPLLLISLAVSCLTGCVPTERIPTYSRMPAAQTLEQLRSRAAGIRNVSAEGTLYLGGADGRSVVLDAAAVLQPVDRARVRARKFGRAVFDLTIIPDGLFLVATAESSNREQLTTAGSHAGTMIRTWLRLMSGQFDASGVDERGEWLDVMQKVDAGQSIVCRIDRRTITPRSYSLLDEDGRERFSLKLSRYIETNGNVWPSRIEATSQTGAVRQVLRLDLRNIEINSDLPAEAFRPPRRAERLP